MISFFTEIIEKTITLRGKNYLLLFCVLKLPNIQCGSLGVILFFICGRLKWSCNFLPTIPYEGKKQSLSLPPKLTHPFSLNFLLSMQASLKMIMQSSWWRSQSLHSFSNCYLSSIVKEEK